MILEPLLQPQHWHMTLGTPLLVTLVKKPLGTILKMDPVKNLKTNSTRKNTKIYVILRAMQMDLKS